MADARDILGVAVAAPAAAERKAKAPVVKRPEGMSREAFELIRNSNPIVTTQLMEELKKGKKEKPNKPTGRGAVVWRARPFLNQARTDGLQLVHWAKGFKDANGRVRDAHEGDYPFAKYNKKVGGWGDLTRGEAQPCSEAPTTQHALGRMRAFGNSAPECACLQAQIYPFPPCPSALRSAPCTGTTRRSGRPSSPTPRQTGAARRRTTCWPWWSSLTSAS
jgi:hypothetical protein